MADAAETAVGSEAHAPPVGTASLTRLAFRTLLAWLAPTAGAGTLAGQARPPVLPGGITVDTLSELRSRFLTTAPSVRIFLPAGYHSGKDRYPLLLANDGQDMESLALVQVLDSLAASRAMEPIIVVAVHAGQDRLQNYGTVGQPNAQGLGANAGNYEQFIVRELLPLIHRLYRVRPRDVSIMGWSLGGLSAFDLAWRNGTWFRRVGVFSGSFWWRTDDSSPEARQSSRIVHRMVGSGKRPRDLVMWFEAGRQDETADRDGNGVIDAIQDTRELIAELVKRGMREGGDLHYVEVEGGHDLATWNKVLPRFLTWAFPPRR